MFKKKPCPICIEKEKRIEDLLTQIEMLRSLALPRNSATPTYVALEADEILSGSDETMHISAEQEAIDREAAALFSGSYDLSQVETY